MPVQSTTLGHQPPRQPHGGPPTMDIGWDGETKPDVPMDVTLHVKSTDENSIRDLREFAQQNGVTISNVDAKNGTVQTHGTTGQYNQAFQITENDFNVIANGVQYHDFMDKTQNGMMEGTLTLPDNLAANITQIDGLDTTPAVIPPGMPLPPG